MPTQPLVSPSEPRTCLDIDRLTSTEIRDVVAARPCIVVPIASMEPWGSRAAIGASAVCTSALARALSRCEQVLCAPVCMFGHSTPVKAFAGVGALRRSTLEAMMVDLIDSWQFQGIRQFIIVDGGSWNAQAAGDALRRSRIRHPSVRALHVPWQTLPEVRAGSGSVPPGREWARAEFAVVSMASWLDPSMVRTADPSTPAAVLPPPEQLRHWQKRGEDPEQFRRAFPSGSASEIVHLGNAEAGRAIYDAVVALLKSRVRQFLSAPPSEPVKQDPAAKPARRPRTSRVSTKTRHRHD